MQAAIFYGGTDIRVEELGRPEPGPGEVLVRVRAAGICGSDLHPYRGADPWPRGPGGHQDGHELAGEVAALGDGVTGLEVGQRVGIEPQHLVGCGRCARCREGNYHLCALRGRSTGEARRSHGFSEYDLCIAGNVHPLPEQVPLDHAAILDCYACAVHAMRRGPLLPLSTVAVIGTGAIGMAVGQLARASGAGRVILVGTRQAPVEVGVASGAADEGVWAEAGAVVEAILSLTGGQGVDTVFETVGGTGPTLSQAVAMARPGGSVCVLGVFTEAMRLEVATAYARELTVGWCNSYSTWRGVSEYRMALDLMAAGRVRPGPLITHHFPLAEIDEAFRTAADKRSSAAIKVIVNP